MEQRHHNRTRSPYNCRRRGGCLYIAAAVTDAVLAPHPRVYSPSGRPGAIRTRATSGYATLYIAIRQVSSPLPTLNDWPTRNAHPNTHLHGDPNRLTALGVSQDVTH